MTAIGEHAIGVIGGSGLYELEGLTDVRWRRVRTPFGDPSDEYCVGVFEGRRVVFLPRHGRGHRLMPSELNFRANIWGLKALGVEWVVSVSAVGSMKEEIRPLDLVVPHQFYDATRRRVSTFFGDGIVAHVGMADPVCPLLAGDLEKAARATGATVHRGGTYLCIEGPQFSTKAESRIYRSWGVDVIGMTNVPEVKLAREAELCYATLALVTDYDVWHDTEAEVTVAGTVEHGQPHIVILNGLDVDVMPESGSYMLVCDNEDRPGMIGRIGTLLGQHDINIRSMQVGRRGRRERAIMLIELDECPTEEELGEIEAIDGIYNVRLAAF